VRSKLAKAFKYGRPFKEKRRYALARKGEMHSQRTDDGIPH